MNITTSFNNELTMSSREIADLTGKRHNNVIRDIRAMFDQLGDDANLSHLREEKDARGYTACFHLDRYHTEVLVTGYDVKRRAAVIKRWYDLETGQAQPAVPAQAKTLDEVVLDAAMRYLNLPESGRILLIEQFGKERGVKTGFLPAYGVDTPSTSTTGNSEVTRSATDLLKAHGSPCSARVFNAMCQADGILERKSRPSRSGEGKLFWSVTEAGQEYGKNITSPQNPRETSPHWYESAFPELLGLLGIEGED